MRLYPRPSFPLFGKTRRLPESISTADNHNLRNSVDITHAHPRLGLVQPRRPLVGYLTKNRNYFDDTRVLYIYMHLSTEVIDGKGGGWEGE